VRKKHDRRLDGDGDYLMRRWIVKYLDGVINAKDLAALQRMSIWNKEAGALQLLGTEFTPEQIRAALRAFDEGKKAHPLPDLKTNEVLFSFDSMERDSHNRLSFTLYWHVGSKPIHDVHSSTPHLVIGYAPGVRAQVFKTDPDEMLARYKAAGFQVRQDVAHP
jgi:hypothetical protein